MQSYSLATQASLQSTDRPLPTAVGNLTRAQSNPRFTLLHLGRSALLSLALILLAGCESTGDGGGGGNVSGSVYYGVGFYDPWYYGGYYYDDPDIIVTPPPRPENPGRPVNPIAPAPSPRPTPRPMPMPSVPSMPRPSVRR